MTAATRPCSSTVGGWGWGWGDGVPPPAWFMCGVPAVFWRGGGRASAGVPAQRAAPAVPSSHASAEQRFVHQPAPCPHPTPLLSLLLTPPPHRILTLASPPPCPPCPWLLQRARRLRRHTPRTAPSPTPPPPTTPSSRLCSASSATDWPRWARGAVAGRWGLVGAQPGSWLGCAGPRPGWRGQGRGG